MTREKAFEILQLDPSASTEKVKQKYENFMRRAKFEESLDQDQITKAYDTIMGINWGNFERDPAYDEKGLNKKKIANFFYHNTRGLIYGTVAFLLVAATIIMIITGSTRFDYKISILGAVTMRDQEVMQVYYEDLLDVKDVQVDYYLNSGGEDSSMDESMMYKLMGDLQGGESGIFIVDEEYSKFLSADGGLMDMTPFLEDFGISADDENILYWYDEYGDQIAAAYRFGTESIFTEGLTGTVPEYFAIPHHAEYSDETIAVVIDLIKQNR